MRALFRLPRRWWLAVPVIIIWWPLAAYACIYIAIFQLLFMRRRY